MSFPLQGGKILKKLLSLLLMCPDLDATFKKNEIPEKKHIVCGIQCIKFVFIIIIIEHQLLRYNIFVYNFE